MGRVLLEDAEGRPVGLPLGKPLALLAFIACSRATVQRSLAAELFWPGARRSDHSLRQAISFLRGSVAASLFPERRPLHLGAEHVRLDVEQLGGITSAADALHLLEVVRGPAFEGLSFDHSPALLEWSSEYTRRVAQDVAAATRRVTADLAAVGRGDEAADVLRTITSRGVPRIEVRDAVFGSSPVLVDPGSVRELALPVPGAEGTRPGPLRSRRVHTDGSSLDRLFGSRRLSEGDRNEQGGVA